MVLYFAILQAPNAAARKALVACERLTKSTLSGPLAGNGTPSLRQQCGHIARSVGAPIQFNVAGACARYVRVYAPVALGATGHVAEAVERAWNVEWRRVFLGTLRGTRRM